MDPNNQRGLFIFSIFILFCIIGCILLIIYTDDKIIKYVSSSIVCILGIGIFKLISMLLDCIKEQKNNNMNEKTTANEIADSKEIVKIIGGVENNMSIYTTEIDKINSEILEKIGKYHTFILNTTNEAQHKNLFIKKKYNIPDEKILTPFKKKFQNDFKTKFLESKQYINVKKAENLKAIEKYNTILKDIYTPIPALNYDPKIQIPDYLNNILKLKVDMYKNSLLFLYEKNNEIKNINKYDNKDLDYIPLTFNNIKYDLTTVNKEYSTLLDEYTTAKTTLDLDINEYDKRNLKSHNIKDELIKNTEFINKAHLKLYELYLKNLERKEIYAKIAPCELYFSKQIEELKGQIKSYQELTTELAAYKLRESEYNSINSTLNTENAELKKKNREITQKLFTNAEQQTELQNIINKLNLQRDELVRELTTSNKTILSSNVEIKNQINEISKLNEIISKNQLELKSLKDINISLTQQIEANIKTIEEKDVKIAELTENIKQLEDEIRKFKDKEKDFNTQKNLLDEKQRKLFDDDNSLNEKNTKIILEIVSLKKQLEDKNNEFAIKALELEALKASNTLNDQLENIKERDTQNSLLREKIAKLELQIQVLQEEIIKITKEKKIVDERLLKEYSNVDEKINELYKEIKEIDKNKTKLKESKAVKDVDFENYTYNPDAIDIINNTKRDLVLLENRKEALVMTINTLKKYNPNHYDSSSDIIDRDNIIKKIINENTRLYQDKANNKRKLERIAENLERIKFLESKNKELEEDLINYKKSIQERIDESIGKNKILEVENENLKLQMKKYEDEKKKYEDEKKQYEDEKKKYGDEKKKYESQINLLESSKKANLEAFVKQFNGRIIYLINQIDQSSKDLIKEIKDNNITTSLEKNKFYSELLIDKVNDLIATNKDFQPKLEAANAEITNLKQQLELSVDQNKAHIKTITELNVSITTLNASIKAKEDELTVVNAYSKLTLEALNNELKKNVSILEEAIKQRENSTLPEEFTKGTKNEESLTEIKRLIDVNIDLNKKITDITAKLDSYITNNNALISVESTYINSLTSFTKKIFSSVFSGNEIDSKIKELEEINEISKKFELIFNAHKTFIENKNKKIEELKIKLLKLENDKELKETEKITELQAAIVSLSLKLRDFETKFTESERKLGLCTGEIIKKDKEIANITKQNTELLSEIKKINDDSERIISERIKPLKEKYEIELGLFKEKNNTVETALEERDAANKEIHTNSEEIDRLKKEIKGNLDNLEKIKTYLLEVQENTILVDNYTSIKKILETKYDKGKEIDQLIKLHEETTKQLLQNKETLDNNKDEISANKEAFVKLELEKKEIEKRLQSEIQQLKDNLYEKVLSEQAYTVKNEVLETQILKLEGENKTLSDRIETYIEEIKTKDAEITTLNEKIATNKESSDMESSEFESKYQQYLEKLNIEKKEIEDKSKELESELSKEIESLKELLTNGSVTSEANTKKLNLKIELLTKVLTRLSFINGFLQTWIKNLNTKNTDLIKKYDELKTSLDKTTTESDKIKKELISIKVVYKLNQNMLRTIKEELNKIKQDLENEINKNKGLTTVNTELVNKINTLENSIIALTSENTSLKDSLRLLNSKFKTLEDKFNSLNKNNSKDKKKYDILLKDLKKLKESKDVIEKNLSLKIDQLEIDKNELERRFKLNNTIKALGSSKLSKQYEDISILYEKQLLEFGKMQARIVQYDIDIKKYIRELNSCRTDLASCETKLNECNANNNNEELLNENQRLKEEINILKSKSTSNNEFIGDEIIILDSSLLSINTKQNTKSKIIVDNDAYSMFLKKNKRI